VWGQIFIFISAILCLYWILKNIPNHLKDIKIAAGSGISLWLIMQFIAALELTYIRQLLDILHIVALSLALVTMLMFIRYLRPPIFRYPYLITIAPLLIPAALILVIDTHLIKEIIFMTIQAIAVIVFLLLILAHEKNRHLKHISMISVLLFTLAFITYWFLVDVFVVEPIFWKFLLASGMIFSVFSFSNGIESTLKLSEEEHYENRR